MRTIWHAGIAALAVIAASSSASFSDSTSEPALTGKMTHVQYLIGTWSCATKVAAFGKMQAHTETGKTVYWIEPGNVVGTYYGSKDFSSSGYLGWMASKNLWWSNSADRFATIGLETGKDSDTNSRVMTGTFSFQEQPAKSRDTFTKNSDTSFRDVVELETNSAWSVVADSTCTKTSDKPTM